MLVPRCKKLIVVNEIVQIGNLNCFEELPKWTDISMLPVISMTPMQSVRSLKHIFFFFLISMKVIQTLIFMDTFSINKAFFNFVM
jgi:hypothetical protein